MFPMITYDRKDDSPTDARWKIVVSVPPKKIKKPPALNREAFVYRVGEWVVIVWSKTEKITGREANEITLYEASKGYLPPSIEEIGKSRIQAIWRQGWGSLITVPLRMKGARRRRHSGAIVEGANSIQVWLRL